jgi:hypothetical protein
MVIAERGFRRVSAVQHHEHMLSVCGKCPIGKASALLVREDVRNEALKESDERQYDQ